MQTTFKDLAALMKDRQELRLNVKKIGEDLVVLVVPNFKEEGKTIQMAGKPEELDENFIKEVTNFKDTIETKFESTVLETEEKEEVDPPKGSEAGRAKAKAEKVKKASKKVVNPKKSGKASKTVDSTAETTENTGDSKTEPTGPTPKEQFDTLMADSKKLFDERKYAEARDGYKAALELFPDNEKTKTALANAEKWVKAVANLTPKKEGEN